MQAEKKYRKIQEIQYKESHGEYAIEDLGLSQGLRLITDIDNIPL